jgi:hypothetical protein
MTPPIVVRSEAAQACIDRFGGKAMAWGKVDCAKIAAHNLRHLGIATSLMKGAVYTSEMGAAKELRARGFNGLGDAMDAIDRVFRIPPAMATTGDVIGLACEGSLWDMALVVSVGNGRVLGIKDGVCAVLQPEMNYAVAAWRCNPCRR